MTLATLLMPKNYKERENAFITEYLLSVVHSVLSLLQNWRTYYLELQITDKGLKAN